MKVSWHCNLKLLNPKGLIFMDGWLNMMYLKILAAIIISVFSRICEALASQLGTCNVQDSLTTFWWKISAFIYWSLTFLNVWSIRFRHSMKSFRHMITNQWQARTQDYKRCYILYNKTADVTTLLDSGVSIEKRSLNKLFSPNKNTLIQWD